MATLDNWPALSGRIRGLVAASHLAGQLLPASLDASPGLLALKKEAGDILKELGRFSGSLGMSSPAVVQAIMRLTATAGPMFLNDAGLSSESRLNHIRSGLVMIAAAEAEISYLLRDRQAAILSRADRAFTHLKRLIVVDESVRGKWQRAFGTGEPECERIGAVHLLGHGIWAFKAHASGGRTDLVYQEPLSDVDLEEVRRTSDGLVLTEWKRLLDGENPAKRFEDARKQSEGYATGVLAGTELRSYRFAILVSKHQVETPADRQEGEITYRHVNIAVEPLTPSKQ
jgi:hypothetical protein